MMDTSTTDAHADFEQDYGGIEPTEEDDDDYGGDDAYNYDSSVATQSMDALPVEKSVCAFFYSR